MPDDLLFLSCFLCFTCSLIDPILPACDVLLRLTCERNCDCRKWRGRVSGGP